MAKWYGVIGFAETVEYKPGSWEPQIIERNYFGDIITVRWNRQNSGTINDDIGLSNRISIIADPYAEAHCASIAYVEYKGIKWRVTSVEIQFPRLVMEIGGEYHE